MSTRTKKETRHAEEIRENRTTGKPVRLKLSTDERVLARISDGIYRQPASALRELVANAYDADATTVTITTDYPRFDTISVRDNGIGMSEDSLVHLIHHIGGSAKRNIIGATLGIVDPSDHTRTPGGRKVIGKIGIGLFSVAQLSRSFTIITKAAGTKHRLVADVVLNTYSEDDLSSSGDNKKKKSTKFETGEVTIISVPAKDVGSHGTEIRLQNLHPSARDMLQSRDIWEKYEDIDESLRETFSKPDWHIGRVDPVNTSSFLEPPKLPWQRTDDPELRFRRLFDAIETSHQTAGPKPTLERTFDRYLQTVWNLSLAAPLDYMEGTHPFDLQGDAYTRFFLLSNDAKKKSAEELKVDKRKTVREAFQKHGISLEAPEPRGNFSVFFDGIKLARPIKFRYPSGFDKKNPKTYPLILIGKCSPPVEELNPRIRGGKRLEFEAYFLWSQVVLPQDHIGTMVRIADNSGTLYNRTFFEYKVQEVIRMRQISSEIFMLHGLDAALNIDRESFNYGHTHTKILVGWIHRVMRQITNALKRIASEANAEKKALQLDADRQRQRQIVDEAYKDEDAGPAREVKITADQEKAAELRKSGLLVFNPNTLPANAFSSTKGKAARMVIYESHLESLAQVLDAYGLLDRLSYTKQQKLLHAIMRIFHEEEEA